MGALLVSHTIPSKTPSSVDSLALFFGKEGTPGLKKKKLQICAIKYWYFLHWFVFPSIVVVTT